MDDEQIPIKIEQEDSVKDILLRIEGLLGDISCKLGSINFNTGGSGDW